MLVHLGNVGVIHMSVRRAVGMLIISPATWGVGLNIRWGEAGRVRSGVGEGCECVNMSY